MRNTKTVILFSNSDEIDQVAGEFICINLNLKVLGESCWLMRFDQDKGVFSSINKLNQLSEFRDYELFVIYDGEVNDQNQTLSNRNKLQIDSSRKRILQEIRNKSSDVHIAFHTKPTEDKKKIIREKCFPDSTEETPLPSHKSYDDGFIFSEVYQNIHRLSHNSNYTEVTFFDKKISSFDEMITIIFQRADKKIATNQYLSYLLCCMSQDTINKNSNIIDNLDIFPMEKRDLIKSRVAIMKDNNYKAVVYQNSFVSILVILDEITRANPYN